MLLFAFCNLLPGDGTAIAQVPLEMRHLCAELFTLLCARPRCSLMVALEAD